MKLADKHENPLLMDFKNASHSQYQHELSADKHPVMKYEIN